jgi:hypothetical protein
MIAPPGASFAAERIMIIFKFAGPAGAESLAARRGGPAAAAMRSTEACYGLMIGQVGSFQDFGFRPRHFKLKCQPRLGPGRLSHRGTVTA